MSLQCLSMHLVLAMKWQGKYGWVFLCLHCLLISLTNCHRKGRFERNVWWCTNIVSVYRERSYYFLNGNHSYVFGVVCVRLFTFCKISTTILRILWRHLPTELRIVFNVFQSISSPLIEGDNSFQIHALLATLSFPKLVQNWSKVRFWIWRSAVVSSDATKKNRNR